MMQKAPPHCEKISRTPQDISVRISADLLDHTSWIQGWIQFNGCFVRKLPYSMWLPSLSWTWVPTPKIRQDIWYHVESYKISMFLACRLKITFTSNPKLIISFLVSHHQYYFQFFKSLIPVALTRHAALNLACLLEVGQQAQCIILKIFLTRMTTKLKKDPQVVGTGTAFLSGQGRYKLQESSLGVARARNTVNFFPMSCLMQETEKNTTNKQHTRTKFQRFVNKAPHSAFRKLIIATPSLLRGL